jgi:ribosomal protein L37AE/L43A
MSFVESYNERAAANRERRHNAAAVRDPRDQHVCPSCGRACASRIGLVSHSRIHQPGR